MPDLARAAATPRGFFDRLSGHRIPGAIRCPDGGHRRAAVRIRTAGLLVAAAILLAATPGFALADGLPAGPTTIAGSVTFFGHGYGHGVGMSQYGARGRAIAGQDAATILGHYYTGTAIGSADPQTPVRVLLRSGFHPTLDHPASVIGRLGPWTIDGLPDPFPADAALVLAKTATGWQLTVTGPDGTVLFDGPAGGDVRVRPAAPETVLQLPFKAAVYNTYRGAVRLIGGVTAVAAINEVPLDDYLLGVVPLEMPQAWPTEALRAQAIAARTYALRRLHPATGTWDVYDDTRSQLYRGVLAEKAATTLAVRDTTGQVLTISGAVANTPFHSSDGGATENNENVYTSSTGAVVVRPVAELRGSSDRAPDGTAYDALAPAASWHTATYTVDQLSAVMAADPRTNVGTITALDLSSRGVSGRLIRVVLYGTLGTKTVSGNLFRAIFNLHKPPGHPTVRSTLFDVAPIP